MENLQREPPPSVRPNPHLLLLLLPPSSPWELSENTSVVTPQKKCSGAFRAHSLWSWSPIFITIFRIQPPHPLTVYYVQTHGTTFVYRITFISASVTIQLCIPLHCLCLYTTNRKYAVLKELSSQGGGSTPSPQTPLRPSPNLLPHPPPFQAQAGGGGGGGARNRVLQICDANKRKKQCQKAKKKCKHVTQEHSNIQQVGPKRDQSSCRTMVLFRAL